MKEGSVVETGNHDELMLNNGEYAKLYNVQARAFSSATEVSSLLSIICIFIQIMFCVHRTMS